MLLRFEREEEGFSLTPLTPQALDGASGLNRASLLTGIPIEGGPAAFLIALGRAVGAPATSSSIKAALRNRGEAGLAELIPDEPCSHELDLAIEDMRGLL